MQTRISKDHYGKLNIKSTKDFTLKDKPARLHITTSKSASGYLNTVASVCWPEKEGQFESETFTVFQDYMQRLAQSKPACKVTEKVASAQHNQALSKLQEVEEEVQAHYSK